MAQIEEIVIIDKNSQLRVSLSSIGMDSTPSQAMANEITTEPTDGRNGAPHIQLGIPHIWIRNRGATIRQITEQLFRAYW